MLTLGLSLDFDEIDDSVNFYIILDDINFRKFAGGCEAGFGQKRCGGRMETVKQGYRRKKVCLPCVEEEKTEIGCMMTWRAELGAS